MDHSAEILAELRAIRVRLDALELRQSPTAPLAEHHRKQLASVLPALAEGAGDRGRCFTTAEALDYLRLNHPRVLKALRTALMHGERGDLSKRVGGLLGAGSGHTVQGVMLERLGASGGIVLWKAVLVSSGFQTH